MREAQRSRRRSRLLDTGTLKGRPHVGDMNRIREQGNSAVTVRPSNFPLVEFDDGVAIVSIVGEYRDARLAQVFLKKLDNSLIGLVFGQLS